MATKGRMVLILHLLCYFSFSSPSFSVTDTVLQGQQLRDWDQLNSANKVFNLKFFSPGTTKNRYLGIFYDTPPEEALFLSKLEALWVANRDSPIPDASGSLIVDIDGNLKITHISGGPIALNSVPAKRNASATLLDSGNLVLRELNADGSTGQVLWQSFDYPTDTLLPGMKLGINFKTGHIWSITSWISDEAPASGSFTLGGDPNGTSQLIIWWRGDVYWTSGLWSNGYFEFAPQMLKTDYYNFSYVSNENEESFTYLVTEDHIFPSYTITSYGWINERGATEDFSLCLTRYGRGPPPGCAKQKQPECRNLDDWFEQKQVKIYGNEFKFDESLNLSQFDCRNKCFNNCSCVAYASTNDNGTGCEIWSQPMNSYTVGPSVREVFFLVEPRRAKKRWMWWMWLIIAVGALLILLSCFLFFFIRRKLRVKGKTKAAQKMLLYELGGDITPSTKYGKANNHKKDKKMNHELNLFSFENIVAATNNFSTTNKLGEGGFGPVYKGKLHDGQEVAIKRLSRSSGQGLVEFKNEIILIAKLQHTNLVRLLGCCIQGEEKILVYEYMSNKSLDFFLFDPSKKELVRWKDRFNIIEGIAQGLLYLHKYSRLRIIHRDLKTSNILLDENMNPKISDFGMARIFGPNESEANTNRVVGTYGYMSPEYAMKGIVSMKTDVFSFGVLLLEIVSGKKNNSCYHSEHPLNLIGYAWELWKEGKAFELTDPTLEDPCPRGEVLRCIHVGLLCVQDHAMDRPSMSDVVPMLTNESLQLPAPKQPAFFIERQEAEIVDNLENCSINKLSISVMEAR